MNPVAITFLNRKQLIYNCLRFFYTLFYRPFIDGSSPTPIIGNIINHSNLHLFLLNLYLKAK